MDQDGTWHGGGLGPGHIVLNEDPAALHKKGAEPSPNFRRIFVVAKRLDASRCHALGMKVGLSPDDFVFDWDTATRRKKAYPAPPNFCPCLLWPNGWIDEDATWYGSRPRPRTLY